MKVHAREAALALCHVFLRFFLYKLPKAYYLLVKEKCIYQ